MSESTLSRRISEFVGVALFALALIWLIALVTYEPTDPVWFFTTDSPQPPANFVGRVGAFLSELSFQLFGYAAYLLPLVIGIVGWHYFWCLPLDAAYTKLFGVTMFFCCASAFLSLLFGPGDVTGESFQPGGSIGTWFEAALSDYLNRTGSLIVLLTMMTLSVILSTQFSFGRLFARASQESRDLSARGFGWARLWIERRRKERERRNVIAKHLKNAGSNAGDRVSEGSSSPGSRILDPASRGAGGGSARYRIRDRPSRSWDASPPKERFRCPIRPPGPCPGVRAPIRFPRRRCSIHRAQSGRSTNGSSWKRRGSSRKSVVSSRWKDRSPRSTPALSSRRSSSSLNRASSTAR